ncbi:AAA family ATPase [Leptolyngbya cf. ectocarpi LEGE 11479]|uniref:AAA family ATPase n=1 Tax=Leptolyngbya cf. ectocarpi LEGE 11479 TaxID=1828722 RepID=A0A929FBB2_LEPEC|nr:AAA family ATPase [Leptolyngbya cf. ectocarpi LEGE 11479]
MNSLDIHLFRKHGKVIHPALPCLSFRDNISATVANIKSQIEEPKKGLVVTVYNNKGGVGKTTTISNLAAVLSQLKKRVLVIDLDANQGDLGDALGRIQVLWDRLSIRKKGWDNSPVPTKKYTHDCIVYRGNLSATPRVVWRME